MNLLSEFWPSVHRVAVFGAILLIALAFPLNRPAAGSDNVRRAVWAGSFYPAERQELENLIDRMHRKATGTPLELPAGKRLRALILPHAGYVYSGFTAAHAIGVLKEAAPTTVIVLGPDHRVGFRNNAVSAAAAYDTPLGRVPVSGQADTLRALGPLFRPVEASDAREHSVEVVLPFLQRALGHFEFVPVVMGPGDPAATATALAPLIEPDTLLVVSSDLSHFLPYDQAVAKDHVTVQAILDLDTGYLSTADNAACGITPILTLVKTARRRGWRPVLLHYSNSGDTARDRARVVGYCAIAFFGDSAMPEPVQDRNPLTQRQGRILIELARRTIAEALGRPEPLKAREAPADDPALQARCGTFITLKIDNQLRGCIGSLDSRSPIVEGVRRNAEQAAFHDPRFPPLTAEELERTDIEVSVLSEPKSLSYADAEDLLAKLRVNIDGVIIRRGPASATFLPQVWEQLPRAEGFLSQLCLKAGLSADAWRRGDLDVQTYQVQYFEEHR